MYVLGADIRKLKPRETIDTIIALHRIRKFKLFGIETNQFQYFLASELKSLMEQRPQLGEHLKKVAEERLKKLAETPS